MLLLAAAEQAAMHESQWGLAWLFTFSSEPPWTCIKVQAPSPGGLRSVGRLADPELLGATVGHMKNLITIGEAQRRTGIPGSMRSPSAAHRATARRS